MKTKTTKATFICQIGENTLKVIKCPLTKGNRKEFANLEIQDILPDTDEKGIIEKVNQIFNNLGYNNQPLIISVPRNHVTCRYLKVPTAQPQEIERIISLQASRFLPYPDNELITGYQSILLDKDGYSHLNLVIVHKDVIERYLRIFKSMQIRNITISLSSYGLCNLYNHIKPQGQGQEQGAVMVIDIDDNEVELAIVGQKKLLFSRYFKFDKRQDNWENSFIDEINKTYDVYIKEISNQAPEKIILLGMSKFLQEYAKILIGQTNLPVDVLSYGESVILSNEISDGIIDSNHSIANLIGFGLENIPSSLNLLPRNIKENSEKILRRKERMQITLFALGIIFIWVIGIAKGLENKEEHLEQLKTELNKISQEAKSLEEIEKRFRLLENRLQQKPTSLDILYEINQIMPRKITLLNLSYEENNQIILHGQTQEMNAVFVLVSALEKSSVLKGFNIKLRYATQKNTQLGEIIDFEIVCLKE